jgi:nucleoside-diphosphate kinase
MAERTLIIIKPDSVQRQVAGQIIARLERKGFKLVAGKFILISKELARKHYEVHKGKPFFEGLVEHLSSSPSFLMVWEAEGIIEISRKMLGPTYGYHAPPGTIRGDFSCSRGYNLIHGSDSLESAEKEISLFFTEEEILEYELSNENWLYGRND